MVKSDTLTLTVSKIPTVITDENFVGTKGEPTKWHFEGYLRRADNLAGLVGKTVVLYVDGVMVKTATTSSGDLAGFFSISYNYSVGDHSVYVEFKGDAIFEGCDNDGVGVFEW